MKRRIICIVDYVGKVAPRQPRMNSVANVGESIRYVQYAAAYISRKKSKVAYAICVGKIGPPYMAKERTNVHYR